MCASPLTRADVERLVALNIGRYPWHTAKAQLRAIAVYANAFAPPAAAKRDWFAEHRARRRGEAKAMRRNCP